MCLAIGLWIEFDLHGERVRALELEKVKARLSVWYSIFSVQNQDISIRIQDNYPP